MRLTQIIEALLFASDAPLTAADLARIDERLDEDTVTAVIEELRGEYDLSERSFQIYEVAGGFQLLTRPEFLAVLERYDTVPQASRLSTPALEVLAIIAYRQPIGRSEIEEIRGVQSAAVLRTLQDRNLIDAVGRSEALGRPLLYGTTAKFLEHFGFRSLEELPRPDELPVVLKHRPIAPADGAAAGPEGQGAEAAGEPGASAEAEGAPAEAAGEPDPSAEADSATAEGSTQAAAPERPGAAGEPAPENEDADEPAEVAEGAPPDVDAAAAAPADDTREPVHAAAAAQEVLDAAAVEPDASGQSGDDAGEAGPGEEDAAAAGVREG